MNSNSNSNSPEAKLIDWVGQRREIGREKGVVGGGGRGRKKKAMR